MDAPHKHTATIVAAAALLICVGLLPQEGPAAENPRIIDGSRVTLMYQITVPGEGGLEIQDVAQFVQGQHQLLPALERVVTGLKPGDEKRVDLSAEDGFGPYDESKKKTVGRWELPSGAKEGDVLEDRTGRSATVAELSDRSAVIDFNHPLAGKPLQVKLKILRVEDPS